MSSPLEKRLWRMRVIYGLLTALAVVVMLATLADHKWLRQTTPAVDVDAGLWRACMSGPGVDQCYDFMKGSSCKTLGTTCEQRGNCGDCGRWNRARDLAVAAFVFTIFSLGLASVVLFRELHRKEASAPAFLASSSAAAGWVTALLAISSALVFKEAKNAFPNTSYGIDFMLLVFVILLMIFVSVLQLVAARVAKRVAENAGSTSGYEQLNEALAQN